MIREKLQHSFLFQTILLDTVSNKMLERSSVEIGFMHNCTT